MGGKGQRSGKMHEGRKVEGGMAGYGAGMGWQVRGGGTESAGGKAGERWGEVWWGDQCVPAASELLPAHTHTKVMRGEHWVTGERERERRGR